MPNEPRHAQNAWRHRPEATNPLLGKSLKEGLFLIRIRQAILPRTRSRKARRASESPASIIERSWASRSSISCN